MSSGRVEWVMLTDSATVRWRYVTCGVSGLNQMFKACVLLTSRHCTRHFATICFILSACSDSLKVKTTHCYTADSYFYVWYFIWQFLAVQSSCSVVNHCSDCMIKMVQSIVFFFFYSFCYFIKSSAAFSWNRYVCLHESRAKYCFKVLDAVQISQPHNTFPQIACFVK